MWPWEHVFFAYVFYSLYVHARYRSRPQDKPTAALAFGSVLPDIVDKPLAWQFDLFETGYAVAHSVFVAVPVSLAVYLIAKRYGEKRIGGAFAVGYLLHLVGDVFPVSLSRRTLDLSPVLWPLTGRHSPRDRGSFVEGVLGLLSEYAVQLLALDVTPVVALQIGSLIAGGTLWLLDGAPGVALITTPFKRATRRGNDD